MTPDFFALPRPPRATETFTLTADGRSITVTLRVMDLLDMHRMVTLRDRMVERYVPFEFRRTQPEDGAPAPVDFPPVGGEPIQLSEETCEACATLVAMQPKPEFGFEQLVACAATCPHLFEFLVQRATALNRSETGNARGGEYGEYVRLALTQGLAHHPEIVQRQDALLCRIDAALGALLRLAGGESEHPFPPLEGSVFQDLRVGEPDFGY